MSEWAQITLAAYLQAALLRKSGPSAAGASTRPTSTLKAVSTAPKPSGPFVCSADISPHSGESPLEGKVVSGANRMRWRRKGSYPGPAPSSVAYGDSLFCGAPLAVTALARECATGAFLFRAHSPRGSLRESVQIRKSRGTFVPRLLFCISQRSSRK